MKIGIVDADLIGLKNHRFPNLACMKISAYYKKSGHNVTLLMDYKTITKYDKVFISKVFTETFVPPEVLNLLLVEYGGTGFHYDKAPPCLMKLSISCRIILCMILLCKML